MDRNNPVWREYLKAVIRIQIDAGVDGIQLDEAELPLTALQYGGCFCKDCMKRLPGLPAGARPERRPELAASTSSGFHYGEWLLERGYDFKERPRVDAAVRATTSASSAARSRRYFAELADYAREYGRERGPRGAASRATSSTCSTSTRARADTST